MGTSFWTIQCQLMIDFKIKDLINVGKNDKEQILEIN